MIVKISMLDKDGNSTKSKSEAAEAMVTFYENKKFIGEIMLSKVSVDLLDEERLIQIFKKYRKESIKKEVTTGTPGWHKPRHDEDDPEEQVVLSKDDWCSGAGGKWVTEDGQHICVGIKDYGKVPNKIRDLTIPVKIKRVEDNLHLEGEFGFASTDMDYAPIGEPQKGSAYLSMVYIKEEHQGKGLGTMLVRRTERELKQDDYKRVYIRSAPEAIGFWKKMGYKTWGEKPTKPAKIEMWESMRVKELKGVGKEEFPSEEPKEFLIKPKKKRKPKYQSTVKWMK